MKSIQQTYVCKLPTCTTNTQWDKFVVELQFFHETAFSKHIFSVFIAGLGMVVPVFIVLSFFCYKGKCIKTLRTMSEITCLLQIYFPV